MNYKLSEFHSDKGLEIEFVGLEHWDDFERIVQVLLQHLACKIIEKYDGPYSRFCRMEKEGLEFRLMHHPELGNALLATIQTEDNNKLLRALGNLALEYVIQK